MKESSAYQTTSTATTAYNVQPDYANLARTNPTDKEKFENWFCTPLSLMKGDQSIICLMILFPLLEKILRHDLSIPTEQEVTLSDNSPALKLLAELLSIPTSEARSFWDCFRNGLMHRAMIKGTAPYALDPDTSGSKPVVIQDGVVRVYVWVLRNTVVTLLRNRGKQMWKDGTHPLPNVF